jgi:hypothetical protein
VFSFSQLVKQLFMYKIKLKYFQAEMKFYQKNSRAYARDGKDRLTEVESRMDQLIISKLQASN